jgi:hypothetical protein
VPSSMHPDGRCQSAARRPRMLRKRHLVKLVHFPLELLPATRAPLDCKMLWVGEVAVGWRGMALPSPKRSSGPRTLCKWFDKAFVTCTQPPFHCALVLVFRVDMDHAQCPTTRLLVRLSPLPAISVRHRRK